MGTDRRPHPRRADVDNERERVWTTDDRDGFINNKNKMKWQFEWAGSQLINKKLLVSQSNLDEPQQQLRTLVLPADPVPKQFARPENYVVDETDWLTTQNGDVIEAQDESLIVTQPSATEASSEDSG